MANHPYYHCMCVSSCSINLADYLSTYTQDAIRCWTPLCCNNSSICTIANDELGMKIQGITDIIMIQFKEQPIFILSDRRKTTS
jgi:hypothetical protein